MRTLYPVAVVLSIGVATMIIQMSGLPAILMGGQSVDTIQADDELNQSVSNNSIGAEGAPDSESSGGFFQFVVGGLSKMVDFATTVVLLPNTLNALPLIPWWFAYPVGVVSEGIVIVGIAEAASQREWT